MWKKSYFPEQTWKHPTHINSSPEAAENLFCSFAALLCTGQAKRTGPYCWTSISPSVNKISKPLVPRRALFTSVFQSGPHCARGLSALQPFPRWRHWGPSPGPAWRSPDSSQALSVLCNAASWWSTAKHSAMLSTLLSSLNLQTWTEAKPVCVFTYSGEVLTIPICLLHVKRTNATLTGTLLKVRCSSGVF